MIAVVVALGRWFGAEIPRIEAHVAEMGFWGPLVLMILVALLTPLFIPDTLFALSAGALFGLLWGTAIMVAGALAASCICYVFSRYLFRSRVQLLLSRNERTAAVVAATEQQGLRIQLLLRLTPLSPVLLSYALGTTRTRFSTFLIACLGIVPGVFVEVYFGYVAKHAAKLAGNVNPESTLHHVATFSGLAICLIAMYFITQTARKALSEASPDLAEEL